MKRLAILPALAGVIWIAPLARCATDDSALDAAFAATDETGFIALLHPVLEALDAKSAKPLRVRIKQRLAAGQLDAARAKAAIEAVEQTWSRLDPEALLEEACTSPDRIGFPSQRSALSALLVKDREKAIALYLRCPARMSWENHNWMFGELARIDPGRGVRLFIETSEGDHGFNNGLDVCLKAWCDKDAAAAWTAASQIDDEELRKQIQRAILKQVSGKPDLLVTLLGSAGFPPELLFDVIPSLTAERSAEVCRKGNNPELWIWHAKAGHFGDPRATIPKLMDAVPPGERLTSLRKYLWHLPKSEKLRDYLETVPEGPLRMEIAKIAASKAGEAYQEAVDDAALNAILAAGPRAYDTDQATDPQGTKLEAMFARFPERSLAWLANGSADNDTLDSRLRNLSPHWPDNKLATDAIRMLEGQSLTERIFGRYLAGRWMAQAPDTAIPAVFSRKFPGNPDLTEFLPVRALVETRKCSRQQVEEYLKRIPDETTRRAALARSDLIFLYRMNALDQVKWVNQADEIPPTAQASKSIASRIAGGGDFDRAAFEALLAMNKKHSTLRDAVLTLLPDELASNKKSAVHIPEVVEAIQPPELRTEVIFKIDRDPGVAATRLARIAFAAPPSHKRTQVLEKLLQRVSPAEAVAIATGDDPPMLRAILLDNFHSDDLTIEQARLLAASCAALPAGLLEPATPRKWQFAHCLADPNAPLAGLLENLPDHWDYREDESLVKRIKSDPPLAVRILSTGPMNEKKSAFAVRSLLLAHGDFPRAFQAFRIRPFHPKLVLPSLFSEWAKQSPAQACAAALLAEPDDVRATILTNTMSLWLPAQPESAATWALSLPGGPERESLIAFIRRTAAPLPASTREQLDAEPASTGPHTPPRPVAAPTDADGESAKRALVRLLAALDWDNTIAAIRKQPDGPAKRDALLALLEVAEAAPDAKRRDALTKEILTVDPKAKPLVDAVTAHSTPLAREVALASLIDDPAARAKAITGILRRHALSAPESMAEPLDEGIHRTLAARARKTLLGDLLDGREPDVSTLQRADLDASTRELLSAWITAHQATKAN